jgi:hypothetical protein
LFVLLFVVFRLSDAPAVRGGVGARRAPGVRARAGQRPLRHLLRRDGRPRPKESRRKPGAPVVGCLFVEVVLSLARRASAL